MECNLYRALLTVWFVALASAPVMAQSMRMELLIPPGSAEAGTSAKVPVQLNSSIAIGASQFELIFDPAVLRFKGIENGPLLPSALVESNVVQPGRVLVAFVSSDEVKGSGELLLAEFEVLAGPSASTTIGFEAVRAWDQTNNLPVIVTARSGDWKRTLQATPSSATPEPGHDAVKPGIPPWLYGLVGVAILILLLISTLLRRRKPTQAV